MSLVASDVMHPVMISWGVSPAIGGCFYRTFRKLGYACIGAAMWGGSETVVDVFLFSLHVS